MKKLLLSAAILISGVVMAQDKTEAKSSTNDLRFGIKAGMNIANLTNTDEAENSVSPRIGINAGAYLHYKFAEKFAFQPELLYSTQGNVQKGDAGGFNIEITYKLDYIALPLMVKYYPVKGFNLEFGPQLAFVVSKKLNAEGNGQSFSYDIDDFFKANDINAEINTFDLGLNLGLGYEFENGLNLGARYSLGMIKVFDGPDVVDATGNEQVIKNSVFSFGLGYTFK